MRRPLPRNPAAAAAALCALVLSGLPALVLSGLPAQAAPRDAGAGFPALVPLASALEDHDVVRDPQTGQTLLRFSNAIANLGPGPLVVVGRSDGDGPPDRDGATMPAFQRILRDDGSFEEVAVGELQYHAVHHHFHLLGAARYRLIDADSGQVLRVSDKVSFCLADVAVVEGVEGAPIAPRYNSCAHNARAAEVTMGVSVGWADVYGKDLVGQAFDVSDLMAQPQRTYLLESTSNPDGLLREANAANPAVVSVEVRLGIGVEAGTGGSRPGV